MKWIIIVLVVLIVLIAIMYLIGYFMPVKHTARISARFNNRTPSEIWTAITNVKAYSEWRSGLKAVEVIDDKNWKETAQGDVIQYQAEVVEPEKRFISRIVNKDLPYGGHWVYEVNAEPAGTLLTITENGEVYNPLFRFMSRYIFGHEATLKKYERDLQNYLAKK